MVGITHTRTQPHSRGHRQQLQIEERRAEYKERHNPDWPRIFSVPWNSSVISCVSYESLLGRLALPQPKVLKEQLNLKPRTLNNPSHLPPALVPPHPSPPLSQKKRPPCIFLAYIFMNFLQIRDIRKKKKKSGGVRGRAAGVNSGTSSSPPTPTKIEHLYNAVPLWSQYNVHMHRLKAKNPLSSEEFKSPNEVSSPLFLDTDRYRCCQFNHLHR